jgi:hypothetical protein
MSGVSNTIMNGGAAGITCRMSATQMNDESQTIIEVHTGDPDRPNPSMQDIGILILLIVIVLWAVNR